MNFLKKEFALDVSKRRGTIPLREVAGELKISAATLNRVEHEHLPDLLTYAELCKWMGVSMNKYFDSAHEEKISDILKHIVIEIEDGNYTERRSAGEEWKQKMFDKINKL